MAMSSNPGPYITQWLETATGKNVLCQKAMMQDRLMFMCTLCCQSLTTTTDAVKTDGTVDYGLQEFVKIHAHKGGHNDKSTGIWKGADVVPQKLEESPGYGKVIPMTADFKKIDLKPEKETAIKQKLEAYNAMMDKAFEDKALWAKIAELQAGKKPGGYIESPAGGQEQIYDANGGPWNTDTDPDAEFAKLKAYENILKIKELQSAIKDAKAKQIQHGGTTQTVTPAKKDKVLAQPTGRKFR